jgi:zinc transporter ZupT
MMPAAFAFFPFVSTMLGGLVALRHKSKLPWILAFTAGVLISVVAFDILPEIIRLVRDENVEPMRPMVALVGGFLLFHVLEKLLVIHHVSADSPNVHTHPSLGTLSALALIGHSFLDGVGIGLGFEVSTMVGILVALAVIAHDFADGLNTVSLVLMHQNPDRRALFFLILDALAPVLGAVSTSLFTLSGDMLVLYLGFFAGFLLYIGASDILPEAHRQRSTVGMLAMTVLGTGLIFAVSHMI